MNLDIRNYGHYRVTSQGGRAFYLFNRQTDRVTNINNNDWTYISEAGLEACIKVEEEKTA